MPFVESEWITKLIRQALLPLTCMHSRQKNKKQKKTNNSRAIKDQFARLTSPKWNHSRNKLVSNFTLINSNAPANFPSVILALFSKWYLISKPSTLNWFIAPLLEGFYLCITRHGFYSCWIVRIFTGLGSICNCKCAFQWYPSPGYQYPTINHIYDIDPNMQTESVFSSHVVAILGMIDDNLKNKIVKLGFWTLKSTGYVVSWFRTRFLCLSCWETEWLSFRGVTTTEQFYHG